jgi:hypothetical protein
MVKSQDVMQELDRIAREEPGRVANAKFDLIQAPWDKTNQNPTLYLRRDYISLDQSDAKLRTMEAAP